MLNEVSSNADSVVISSDAFWSMSVMSSPLQSLGSVVVVIRLFRCWGLWDWSHLVWALVFDPAAKGGPPTRLELPTTSPFVIGPLKPLLHDNIGE